jgi:malate synthase
MGGMAAFIPSRRDADVNERAFAKVREDKHREAGDGFDGSWVAHPDLVPLCAEEFDAVLGDRPNQLDRLRDDVKPDAAALIDLRGVGGGVTSLGLRANISVGVRYLEAWLGGNGAAAIDNLMEDAATAEIARSQVWQWVHGGVRLADTGDAITPGVVRAILDEVGFTGRARDLFEQVALADDFAPFLTLPAYELID